MSTSSDDEFFQVYNKAKAECAPVDVAVFKVAWALCSIEPESMKLGPRASQPWCAERWRDYVIKARIAAVALMVPSDSMLISASIPPDEARKVWTEMIRPLVGVVNDIEKTPDGKFQIKPIQYWEPDDAM